MDIHLKLASEVDPVAVVALILSIIGGVFSFWVWWNTGPSAKFNVEANKIFLGAGFSPEKLYISFSVTNTGDRPITLKGIYGRHWHSRWQKFIGKEPQCFYVNVVNYLHQDNIIPSKIGLGEEWIGFMFQTPEVEKMLQEYVEFQATHTFSTKPLKKHIKLKSPDV